MINPIVDNRIVNDITFARRLLLHLENIQVNDGMSEEEVEYLKRIAFELLEYQLKTCVDEYEINYHNNCSKKDLL